MAGLISIFIILFSCLGLFGLASYNTQRRTKEIGIRKVHGATIVIITRLITGLAAVLFQTIKAARANPIEALRYE